MVDVPEVLEDERSKDEWTISPGFIPSASPKKIYLHYKMPDILFFSSLILKTFWCTNSLWLLITRERMKGQTSKERLLYCLGVAQLDFQRTVIIRYSLKFDVLPFGCKVPSRMAIALANIPVKSCVLLPEIAHVLRQYLFLSFLLWGILWEERKGSEQCLWQEAFWNILLW